VFGIFVNWSVSEEILYFFFSISLLCSAQMLSKLTGCTQNEERYKGNHIFTVHCVLWKEIYIRNKKQKRINKKYMKNKLKFGQVTTDEKKNNFIVFKQKKATY
jgi:hypothetical protein